MSSSELQARHGGTSSAMIALTALQRSATHAVGGRQTEGIWLLPTNPASCESRGYCCSPLIAPRIPTAPLCTHFRTVIACLLSATDAATTALRLSTAVAAEQEGRRASACTVQPLGRTCTAMKGRDTAAAAADAAMKAVLVEPLPSSAAKAKPRLPVGRDASLGSAMLRTTLAWRCRSMNERAATC